MTLPLALELYDRYGRQYQPGFRNLKFAKTLFGGEDLWMIFVLDRASNVDYPDVAYGNDVILRDGLDARFAGEMRQIESDIETVTVKVLGKFIHLDDRGYGGMGRLWCDSRYGRWRPLIHGMRTGYMAEKFEMDNQNELYIAPRTGEYYRQMSNVGSWTYLSPHARIFRVSFDYDIDLVHGGNDWIVLLRARNEDWIQDIRLWQEQGVDQKGAKDVIIPGGTTRLELTLALTTAAYTYDGETGLDVYAKITNLRVWGERGTFDRSIESPSVVHLAEDVVQEASSSKWLKYSEVGEVMLPGGIQPTTSILCAIEYGGYIYIGTAEDAGSGKVWRSTDLKTWEIVYSPGDGNVSALGVDPGNFIYCSTQTNIHRTATGNPGTWGIDAAGTAWDFAWHAPTARLYRITGSIHRRDPGAWVVEYAIPGTGFYLLSDGGDLYAGNSAGDIYRGFGGTLPLTWVLDYATNQNVITGFARFGADVYAGSRETAGGVRGGQGRVYRKTGGVWGLDRTFQEEQTICLLGTPNYLYVGTGLTLTGAGRGGHIYRKGATGWELDYVTGDNKIFELLTFNGDYYAFCEFSPSVYCLPVAFQGAQAPISKDKELVQESVFVRDTFIGTRYHVLDSFTDANGTSLDAHVPDIDAVGGGWSEPVLNFHIWDNHAEVSALTGGQAIGVIDAGVSDGVVLVTTKTQPAGAWIGPMLVFRYQDANNYWALKVEPQDGKATLFRYATGWIMVQELNIGVAWNTWYDLRVVLRGDRIDCYVNDIWRFGTINAWLQTETDHGIRGAYVNCPFDNFIVAESLEDHSPDIDKERNGWVEDRGHWDIRENQANLVDIEAVGGYPQSQAEAYIEPGISDGILTVDVICEAAGNGDYGLLFRYLNADNGWFYYVEPNTGNLVLERRIAGAQVEIFSINIGVQYEYTYNLMVKMRGDKIDCYVGGIWRGGTTDASFYNFTKCGLYAYHGDAVGVRFDNFEFFQALPIWPLFYEKGESCHKALKDVSGYGDWLFRALGWGVEPGGNRVYVKQADRSRVRYIVPPDHATRLSAKGRTDKKFITAAWGQYIDEDGVNRVTEKHFAHMTPRGVVANTTATGNDLVSTVYNVCREKVVPFGRVDVRLVLEYLKQYLEEHAWPRIRSTFEIFGPVQDLDKGGIWIQPYEMEMGYVVQIPHFRAVEVVGGVDDDIRDFATTFLAVAMQYDLERGRARLIPEGAEEDLQRVIDYAKEFEGSQDALDVLKRPEPSFRP